MSEFQTIRWLRKNIFIILRNIKYARNFECHEISRKLNYKLYKSFAKIKKYFQKYSIFVFLFLMFFCSFCFKWNSLLKSYFKKFIYVTANITPGFTKFSASLWVSGQNAFLVIWRWRVGRMIERPPHH